MEEQSNLKIYKRYEYAFVFTGYLTRKVDINSNMYSTQTLVVSLPAFGTVHELHA